MTIRKEMLMHTKIDPNVRKMVTIILLVSTFISLMSQTMMITALPVIQHDVHRSLNTVQWLTTGYTLMIGVITPLSSNLYECFTGLRGNQFWDAFGCPFDSGLSRGNADVVSNDHHDLDLPARKAGFDPRPLFPGNCRWTGDWSVHGRADPTFLNWHYLFILVLPFMVLACVLGYFMLPNYSTPHPIHIDFFSVVISLIGSALTLGSLTTFTVNSALGWAMLISGLVILTLFVRRQLRLTNPVLKVKIMTYPSFCLMTIVGILAFMVLLSTEQLLPIYAENVRHTGSFISGMILLPGAICNAITAFFAGKLYDQYGPKWLITTGGLLILLASIPLVTISTRSSLLTLTLAYTVRMIGNALVFSPALSEAFRALSKRENSHGSALNNTLRQSFGAVAVTMCVVIADIPASLVAGIKLAMWVTVLLAVLMLLVFWSYLAYQKRQATTL